MTKGRGKSTSMPVARNEPDNGLVVLPPPPGSFLAWYDDTTKIGIVQKIADALGRYQYRFGAAADVAYINPADAADANGPLTIIPPDGVELRAADRIPRNNVWVGQSESAMSAR